MKPCARCGGPVGRDGLCIRREMCPGRSPDVDAKRIDPKRAAEDVRAMAQGWHDGSSWRESGEYAAALCEREDAVERLLDAVTGILPVGHWARVLLDNVRKATPK